MYLSKNLEEHFQELQIPLEYFWGFVLYNQHIPAEVGQMLGKNFSAQWRASTLGCEVSLQGAATWTLKAERKVLIADQGLHRQPAQTTRP